VISLLICAGSRYWFVTSLDGAFTKPVASAHLAGLLAEKGMDVRDPQPGPTTPRLRGVAHQWVFVASIFTGTALVLSAPSSRARLAAAIYASASRRCSQAARCITVCGGARPRRGGGCAAWITR
jgi:hypothetical protein